MNRKSFVVVSASSIEELDAKLNQYDTLSYNIGNLTVTPTKTKIINNTGYSEKPMGHWTEVETYTFTVILSRTI